MTKNTENVCKLMIDYFGDDVRRINHAIKVAGFARSIGIGEGIDDNMMQIIEICGYLHDVGIKLAEEIYQSSSGSYQEKLGPDIVRRLLEDITIDNMTLDRICFIIGHHHTYSAIDGIDFQILVEADFLVNIYEDQMQEEAIENIYHKIIKTKTGQDMFKKMYLHS